MTGSVQLNKGYWYCVLNMRDENGKPKKKWISTGLPEKGNKRKAEKRLQELKVKYGDNNVVTNYADMLFSDYCDYWLKSKKISLDVITYEGYEIRIKHIKKYFGDRGILLSKITPRNIKEFYEYLLTEGNMAKYKKNKGLSYRTVKDISLLLKAILREALLVGDILDNPAERAEVPKKKQERKKEDVYIDVEEIPFLYEAIKGHILEELIMITLYLGLRRSEVLGLKWSALDFEKSEVHINHTIVKVKESIAKDTTKTEASYRKYPLSEVTKEMFLRLKRKQEINRKLFGSEYIDSDYIFTWEDGRLISPDYVTKAFKKIVKKSEHLSSELTFHDLRKSCVTMMILGGYSVKETQEWVGHADVETTLKYYTKMKESKKIDIALKMDEKFKCAI